MADDERSINDRLRAKHIRTLEMLQAVVNENAKLKAKLDKVVAFSDSPHDDMNQPKLFAPCHSDQLEFKLAEELRLLKLDYDDKCKQLRDLQNQAEKRRLSTEQQAETRIGVARRKQQAAEKRAKELEAELAQTKRQLQGARKQSKELETDLQDTHAEHQKDKSGDLRKGVELIHLRECVAELEKQQKKWEQERVVLQGEIKAAQEEAMKERLLLQKSEDLVTEAQQREHEASEQHAKAQASAEAELQRRKECEQQLKEMTEQLSSLQAELALEKQRVEDLEVHNGASGEEDNLKNERLRLVEENSTLQKELQRLGIQLRDEKEDARVRITKLTMRLEAMENAPVNNGRDDAELKKEIFMLRKQMDGMRQMQMHGQMQMHRQPPRRTMDLRQVSGGVGHSSSRDARGRGRIGSQSMPRLPKMAR